MLGKKEGKGLLGEAVEEKVNKEIGQRHILKNSIKFYYFKLIISL